jgi:hypothetical protein
MLEKRNNPERRSATFSRSRHTPRGALHSVGVMAIIRALKGMAMNANFFHAVKMVFWRNKSRKRFKIKIDENNIMEVL